MNIAAVVLLGLIAVLGLLLTAQGERVRPTWGALFLAFLAIEGHSAAVRQAIELLAAARGPGVTPSLGAPKAAE